VGIKAFRIEKAGEQKRTAIRNHSCYVLADAEGSIFFGFSSFRNNRGRMLSNNPCRSCGACCAHYRVSFYWNGLYPTVVSGNKPILCARCHASNALTGTGLPGIKSLTQSTHGFHAGVADPASGQMLDGSTNRKGRVRTSGMQPPGILPRDGG
jgi:hypothetical protein